MVLRGHTAYILALSMWDGFLFSAAFNGEVYRWDIDVPSPPPSDATKTGEGHRLMKVPLAPETFAAWRIGGFFGCADHAVKVFAPPVGRHFDFDGLTTKGQESAGVRRPQGPHHLRRHPPHLRN